MSQKELSAILNTARNNCVDFLDTAIAYGSSQERLGKENLANFQIVTKLPKGSKNYEALIKNSLEKLGLLKLYGVLWHSSIDVECYQELMKLRELGLCSKIGVSIYEPEELERFQGLEIDLVQLPWNVFDRRFQKSGAIEKLLESGIEIHVRSVFLQGLLLMQKRHSYFDRWSKLWAVWDDYLKTTQQSSLEACVNFARNLEGVSRVIIGVDSLRQFEQIITCWKEPGNIVTPDFFIDDVGLLNPGKWLI